MEDSQASRATIGGEQSSMVIDYYSVSDCYLAVLAFQMRSYGPSHILIAFDIVLDIWLQAFVDPTKGAEGSW
jgi:hypothetical protein